MEVLEIYKMIKVQILIKVVKLELARWWNNQNVQLWDLEILYRDWRVRNPSNQILKQIIQITHN
jgi:hypothetical protein